MDKEDGKLALDRVPTPTPLPSCTNGTDAQGKSVPESDDRSSSLSEIDDGPDQEELENKDEVVGEPLPENDSEAETERLENSPQKLGKLKNVVLSSSLQGDDQASGKLLQRSTFAQREVDDGEGSAEAVAVVTNNIVTGRSVGELKHSSPATTLVGSFAGSVKGSSPSGVAGKKRKRANPGNQETSDGIDDMDIARKQNSPIKSEHNDNGSSTQHFFSDQDGEECHREVDDPTASDVEAGQTDEDGTAVKNDGDKPLPTRNKKGKTGKRKGKKQLDGSPGDSAQIAEKAVDDIYGDENGQVLEIDNVDEGEGLLAADGEGEEAEAEAEAAARTEEERKSKTLATHHHIALSRTSRLSIGLANMTHIVAKKRVAMDSLGAIEKHFAAFRDKYVTNESRRS